MLNSRDINALRPDVAANAMLWIAECKANGLDIEISNTVRDNEYQAYLYASGRTREGSIVTNAKTTTFHGAGLAIDFYSKSKGWSDHNFFIQCAAIAKKYGFSWAGDWKSFVEYCHIQWDNHRKSSHRNTPQMPLYKEEEDMTKEQTQTMINEAMKAQKPAVWDKLEDVPEWGKATVEKLMECGAIKGNNDGNLELNLDQLRVLVINDKAGLYGGLHE